MITRRLLIRIRLYIAILGVLILYTAIHEFAYRKYEHPEAAASDSTRTMHPDTASDTSSDLLLDTK